jgi:hypothetical protein
MAQRIARSFKARNQRYRKIKLFIDLPEQQPFTVKFERASDKKIVSMAGMYCNKEYYTPEYLFSPREPYVLGIGELFEGDIIISNVCQKEIRYPVHQGNDEITIALVQPQQDTENTQADDSVNQEYDKENNLTFFQTNSEYFQRLENEVYEVTDGMRNAFIELFQENKNVVYGVVGDVTQEFYALKDGVWRDIKGLQFYIKEIQGKTYVILKGFGGLRETLKGTRYLLTNPQIGAFVATSKDLVSWSSIVNGTKITILISSVFSLIDYFTTSEGKADFTDIVTNLLTGIGKALVSYWVGVVAATLAVIAGGALVSAGIIASVPALAIFLVGAGVSIGVGIYLNLKDSEYGWTSSLQAKVNELQEDFSQKIEQIEEEMAPVLNEFHQILKEHFGSLYLLGNFR